MTCFKKSSTCWATSCYKKIYKLGYMLLPACGKLFLAWLTTNLPFLISPLLISLAHLSDHWVSSIPMVMTSSINFNVIVVWAWLSICWIWQETMSELSQKTKSRMLCHALLWGHPWNTQFQPQCFAIKWHSWDSHPQARSYVFCSADSNTNPALAQNVLQESLVSWEIQGGLRMGPRHIWKYVQVIATLKGIKVCVCANWL